jgi:hypothetical protein
MNALPRWPLAIAGAGAALLLLLVSGCAVPGGYEGTYLGYYEPYGFSYGGWGTGYDVGPWRAGGFPHGHGGEVAQQHAFRPAPAGHAMPSIPSHARPAGGAPHGQHR